MISFLTLIQSRKFHISLNIMSMFLFFIFFSSFKFVLVPGTIVISCFGLLFTPLQSIDLFSVSVFPRQSVFVLYLVRITCRIKNCFIYNLWFESFCDGHKTYSHIDFSPNLKQESASVV